MDFFSDFPLGKTHKYDRHLSNDFEISDSWVQTSPHQFYQSVICDFPNGTGTIVNPIKVTNAEEILNC